MSLDIILSVTQVKNIRIHCLQESIKTLTMKDFSIFLMNNQTEMIEVIVTVNQFTNYLKKSHSALSSNKYKVFFQPFLPMLI